MLFSRRTADLEVKNRILTDASRKRAQRIEELERELQEYERVKSERVLFPDRVTQLEEHNRQLTESAAKQALRVQELERELLAARTEIATNDYPRVEAERAFYFKRAVELEEHNRQLTESATKHALRAQELERELLAARTEIATKDFPRVEAERAFYLKRVGELEENNRQLTESATKYALRVQKLERAIGTRLPDFEGDDGTVEFAKACGIYIAVVEAPVSEDRLVAPAIANPSGTVVILAFGQSNAANAGDERYTPRGAVHVFNMFDMKFYRAVDPLPGASHDGGSVWSRLGDKLIDAGAARSVLIVAIALGATYIEDWAPGGKYYRRLLFALHRCKLAGVNLDMLCWQQGEANANHTGMSAAEYYAHFHSMLRQLREAEVKAPVYVALATLCEEAPHPFKNSAQIRLGQKQLVSIQDRILPGPDTDRIGIEHRRDGCHFSASGQELAAQAWCKAITAGRLKKRMVWARYRLECMFASRASLGDATSPRQPEVMRTPLGQKIEAVE